MNRNRDSDIDVQPRLSPRYEQRLEDLWQALSRATISRNATAEESEERIRAQQFCDDINREIWAWQTRGPRIASYDQRIDSMQSYIRRERSMRLDAASAAARRAVAATVLTLITVLVGAYLPVPAWVWLLTVAFSGWVFVEITVNISQNREAHYIDDEYEPQLNELRLERAALLPSSAQDLVFGPLRTRNSHATMQADDED